MKITAGKYKGKNIASKKEKTLGAKVRPTSSKVKEAIFNILIHNPTLSDNKILDANILDICCGTGALAIEALSRGAKSASFIDYDSGNLKIAKENIEKIAPEKTCFFYRMDALKINERGANQKKYNLVFIDPPYDNKNAGSIIIRALLKGDWLESDAIIVLEVDKEVDLDVLSPFEEVVNKKYNRTKIYILRLRVK